MTKNGPPGLEVGPQPGHHPAPRDTDTNTNSTPATYKPKRRHDSKRSSKLYGRHRQARRDHILCGCKWCADMPDGRQVLSDVTVGELRDLYRRVRDEQARAHIMELARRRRAA